jgi:uncharacterized oligopeptide transporter (OPT) family protein
MNTGPAGTSALTAKSLSVGLALSVVVAMYSAYAGLKVGGVYWPIITATLMAMGLLKLLGGATRQEISVAATAASTGGLLAAGIIFTVPALWLAGLEVSPLEVTSIALVGGLLGVAFTLPLREEMIERLALPYPDGTATARIIEAGDEGGGKVRRVLAAFAAAGAFSLVRDGFGWLPGTVNLESLRLPAARWFSFGSAVTLVSAAGGFLIGPRFTSLWFAGGATSYLVAVPALVASGRFPDKGAAVAAVTRPFGIGVIIGASFAYFLFRGLPALGPLAGRLRRASRRQAAGGLLALAAAVAVVSVWLDLPAWLTAVAIAGAFAVSYVAARIAGELNIDPMEIFAIAVLLVVLLFVRLAVRPAVVFAALLAIAAGMAGDFMQDLKAGALVGTRPRDQTRAQLASVVVSALAMGMILSALHRAYTIGSVDLPAPQAVALASIVEAGKLAGPLGWGAAAGAVATAAAIRWGQGLLPVAFGIGLYAPIELSLPLWIGGLIRLSAERRGTTEGGRLIAAGLIGGEGFVGVLLALLSMFGVL